MYNFYFIFIPLIQSLPSYSNFFLITNSPSEFILDFGRILPGVPDAKIYTRVVTTPQHAKQFLQALEKNIENYESQFGEIKVQGQQENRPVGFKPDTQGVK